MYLIKFPVMFLNGSFILTPDVHPETLLLTELPQPSLGVGGGGVGLAVLLLPGLNKSSFLFVFLEEEVGGPAWSRQ